MAQASEELLIKIDIVDSDSANRINEISEELNNLKATQKDYEQAVKEGKQLTTEQGKEYVAVKARIADLNKEVNAHVKALQKEQQEQKKNADSLNSMRAQLKDLIKAYDNMSKAERENAEIGGKQVAMINQLTDQIKELEEGTQRYQRNVGNYANYWSCTPNQSSPSTAHFLYFFHYGEVYNTYSTNHAYGCSVRCCRE